MQYNRYTTIGTKHVFLYIYIGGVETRASKARVLTIPRGLADVSASKIMFDRYHCIKSVCHLKTLGNASKSSFLYYYNGEQKHEGFVGFESNDLHHSNVT